MKKRKLEEFQKFVFLKKHFSSLSDLLATKRFSKSFFKQQNPQQNCLFKKKRIVCFSKISESKTHSYHF